MTSQKSHHVPERIVQMLLKLCQASAVTTSLRSLCRCPKTLWVKNLLLISNLILPWHSSMPSDPVTDQHRAEISAWPSRGSCRLQWGVPSVPSPPGCPDQVTSATPQTAFPQGFSPPSLLSFLIFLYYGTQNCIISPYLPNLVICILHISFFLYLHGTIHFLSIFFLCYIESFKNKI